MSDSYNFPRSMWELLDKHVGQCKNLALILDKYPPDDVPGNSQGESEWLKRLEPNGHIDTALTQSAYARWRAMISAMGVIPFHAALDWRMAIGLGGESVLETDLTLHHLYGIPFIPGSALKGLTRAYVTGEIEEYKSDKIDSDKEEVKRIFGSQEQAGTVLFFDAMPLNGEVQFVVDIMNPHYPDYYGGTKPPTNDQSPIPVTFLTVTDTTFTFALASRDAGKEQHMKDVEQVKGWLQEALQKYGVGGKTSAGYGYFKIGTQPVPSIGQQGPTTQTEPRPTERLRPRLPQFRAGQEITGSVVVPTDDIRRRAPDDVRAFLRYQSFATTDVLIVVSAEEAQNWKPGETRICVFVREEEQNGCTMLVCQPRVKRDKDKK